MTTKLLPPNEPLVSPNGNITTNWWRVLQALTQIQVTFATPKDIAFVADWSSADEIRVTLTTPVLTITNAGASDGQRCVLTLMQDNNGGRLVSFTAETDFGLAGSPIIDLSPNARTHIELIFQAPLGLYDAFVLFSTDPHVLVPPTSDPHVVGALWNNAGVPTFSVG